MNEYLMLIDQIHLEESINSLLNDRVILTEGVNIKEKLKKIIDIIREWAKKSFKIIIDKFTSLVQRIKSNKPEHKPEKEKGKSDEMMKDEYIIPKNGIKHAETLSNKADLLKKLTRKIIKYDKKQINELEYLLSNLFDRFDTNSTFNLFTDVDDIKANKNLSGDAEFEREMALKHCKRYSDKLNKSMEENDCKIDKDYFNKDFYEILNGFNPDKIKEDMEENTISVSYTDMDQCKESIIKSASVALGVVIDVQILIEQHLIQEIEFVKNQNKEIQSTFSKIKSQIDKSGIADMDMDIYNAYSEFLKVTRDHYEKVFESYNNINYLCDKILSINNKVKDLWKYMDHKVYDFICK